MNKLQLLVLWLLGLAVSSVISSTGFKLLAHSATNPETLATGYPLTLIAGTAWGYIVPLVIIGAILIYTVKDWGK